MIVMPASHFTKTGSRIMTFKTAFKAALTSMTLMLVMISGAYASPVDKCKFDFSQMNNQIAKDKSITTTNGYQIDRLIGPAMANGDSCRASGKVGLIHFKLSWKAHNWGNTLLAVRD